jgi:hypothetical protein
MLYLFFFSLSVFWVRVLLCCPNWFGTHCVAQAGLQLLILLPQPTGCWDYMCALLYTAVSLSYMFPFSVYFTQCQCNFVNLFLVSRISTILLSTFLCECISWTSILILVQKQHISNRVGSFVFYLEYLNQVYVMQKLWFKSALTFPVLYQSICSMFFSSFLSSFGFINFTAPFSLLLGCYMSFYQPLFPWH